MSIGCYWIDGGDWVKYADYLALEAERDALKRELGKAASLLLEEEAERDALKRQLQNQDREYLVLKCELEALRAKLAEKPEFEWTRPWTRD